MILDLGMTVGGEVANNTYFKLKLGKGNEEASTLNKIVEEGTGMVLDEAKHTVSFRIQESADPSQLLEMIEGMMEGVTVEQVAGKNGGKWLVCHLTEAVGTDIVNGDLEAQLDEFFATCPENSYLEFGFQSGKTFEDALEIAKAQGEANEDSTAPTESSLPSFLTFMNNLDVSLRCDINPDFALNVLNFVAKTMKLPLDAEMFQFIKKFQCLEARWNFNSIDELQDGDKAVASKNLWSGLGDMKSVLGEVEPFVSLFNEMTCIFTLRNSAFLKLEFRAPGLQAYAAHMGKFE